MDFFCECNSVRIGQNIHNEVSLERSIFSNVVTYKFTSFHMGTKTTLAVPKGLIFVRRSFLRRTKGVQADPKLTRVLEIRSFIPWNVNFL